MAYNLVIKKEAPFESLDAYWYYENISSGLGDKFLHSLRNSYKHITDNPQHCSYVSKDREKTMRDIKAKGFPYLVIYDTEGPNVVVYAVHNTSKKTRF